jgi:hypothetical protein
MKILKYKYKRILITVIGVISASIIGGTEFGGENDVIIQQVPLEGNNIRTWMINTGIWNQDLRYSNTPGFEWPAGSHKFAVFTTGLSIAAYVEGQLREAMASYKGEYAPGYVIDSAGIPKAKVDSRFKIYSVKRTDNWINNPDWLNWYLMIPFGAPYIDVNNSGYYEPFIDTPGVKGAEHTLFACLTDGFPDEHKIGEGFGGGTAPLYAELHFTAWSYNVQGLQDVQFLKWDVINKCNTSWNKTFFSIICDADLGYCCDDYVGCDTLRNMGYCYNGDNDDSGNLYSYGINPPAVGFDLLRGAVNRYANPQKIYNMTSFNYFTGTSILGPSCEKDPNGEQLPAYQFMRGYKKDGTPWLNPIFNPPRKTKYCFSGDPETNSGWTEYTGKVGNCYGDTTGSIVPSPVGDRRLMFSSGADNFTVNPGDTQKIMIAQFIARGTNNLNSVTKLKQLDDYVQAFADGGFVIGVNQISNNTPSEFELYQNYPNPFNPVTTIRFDIPSVKSGKAKIKIVVYDILGKQIAELINEELSPGSYKVDWDASNYPSGVYFYKLTAEDYSFTRKMVLLK